MTTFVRRLPVIQHRRTEMFVSFKEGRGGTQMGVWVRDPLDGAHFESVGEAAHFCRTKFPATAWNDFQARQIGVDAQGNAKLIPQGEEVW
jgi:hypothetical protein